MMYRLPIRVSPRGLAAVEDVSAAYAELVLAEKGSEQAGDAYVRLTMRKYELLDYIAHLEHRLRIPRNTFILQSPFTLPDLKRYVSGPAELSDEDRRSPYRDG